MIDSRYIRIATRFWQDEKGKELSDDGKLLYLYILTSPHSNMAGYYVLPKPYALYDLKWPAERLGKPFDELLRNGLIKYCESSDVVLIPNFFRYNPIQNKNQAKGASRRIAELPGNTLVGDFLASVKRFAESFYELFGELLPERLPNPETDTETDTESETATETETDAREAALESNSKPDVVDDVDQSISKIVKEFSIAFGYPPNQTQMQMLISFLDDGLTDWHIFEALKRAAEAGASSPKYATTILQSWLAKKAFAKEDVERLDGSRSPKGKPDKLVTEDYVYKEPVQDRSRFAFLNQDQSEEGTT